MMGCSRYGDGSIGETQSSRRPATPSIKPRYILMHTICINTISAKSKYICCSHCVNETFANRVTHSRRICKQIISARTLSAKALIELWTLLKLRGEAPSQNSFEHVSSNSMFIKLTSSMFT